MSLAEAYVHCGEIARAHERDLWLAALFAPERLRPHLCALAAFAHEVGAIAARAREPLAGEMRLAWWREALSGARPAETAGAPVAAAMLDTIARFALPTSRVEDLLQALTFDVYDEAMASVEALEAYGIATAGTLTALRARVLADGQDPDVGAASDAAGAGLGLARATLDFAAGRRKPLLLPSDLLARHGVSPVEARAGQAGEGLAAALEELAKLAAARLDAAEARLAEAPHSAAPAFAPLATARLDLERWRRRRSAFTPAAPWRRQWALWRWMQRR